MIVTFTVELDLSSCCLFVLHIDSSPMSSVRPTLNTSSSPEHHPGEGLLCMIMGCTRTTVPLALQLELD